MIKTILSFSAAMGILLAALLWTQVERREYSFVVAPETGGGKLAVIDPDHPMEPLIVVDEPTGEAITRMPQAVIDAATPGDRFEIRVRRLKVPRFGRIADHVEYCLERPGQTQRFTAPGAGRFWGAFVGAALAPLFLGGAIAGALAAGSAGRKGRPGA